MADDAKGKNNVGVIVTMLVGWAAIWGAMHLQLKQITDAIDGLRTDIVVHEGAEGHPSLGQKVVTLDEALKEVETQFKWMSDVININRDQNERFQSLLWVQVFSVDLPRSQHEALRINGK